MSTDRDLLRRVAAGLAIAAVALVVAYALSEFIAVAVFAVFLYYAIRPIFRQLSRLGLGRRVRAMLSILLFGLPFLVLIAYSVAIVAVEIRSFVDEQDVIAGGTDRLTDELNIAGLDLDALGDLAGGSSQTSLELAAQSLLDAASLVGGFFVQVLLVVIAAYYMLVDGPRLIQWLLDTYDETGVSRRYVREVDGELSLALFGNIVNVFITAIVAIGTFYVYNALTSAAISIPFPAVLGALAGIGSLVPVVGIKLVYVPLCLGLGANAWLAGQPELLVPVAVLFVVSAIVVDFIPDFVIRAQVSSDNTHSGLLLIAYIVGPSAFGFYGLFLAPIVLICATNAVTVLLPYALGGHTDPAQTRLDRFGSSDAPEPGETPPTREFRAADTGDESSGS